MGRRATEGTAERYRPAPSRNVRNSGPAVREPDSPSCTNTATARSPWPAIIQACVLYGALRRTPPCRSLRSPPAATPLSTWPLPLGHHRPHHLLQLGRLVLLGQRLAFGLGLLSLDQDGSTVCPALTEATDAGHRQRGRLDLALADQAAARPVAVGSSGTEPKKEAKPMS